MKNLILTLLLAGLFLIPASAQDNTSYNEGDTFVIGNVLNDNYKHIHFPRTNFIIKKGGIENYDLLKGKEVEITSIREKKDGTTLATIKLSSGKRFFNSHKYIKVDIDKAVETKELYSK